MTDYIGITPTVVIGLGGTGKEILIKVRRMITESYGSLDSLPIVSFLHIDVTITWLEGAIASRTSHTKNWYRPMRVPSGSRR